MSLTLVWIGSSQPAEKNVCLKERKGSSGLCPITERCFLKPIVLIPVTLSRSIVNARGYF